MSISSFTTTKQNGIALISIMIIVVLVAALATQMHWDQQIAYKRLEAELVQESAKQYALGAENWAREILNDDYKEAPDSDNLTETWAQALPALPIEGGQIQGRIEDLQGRFNLNNLINSNGEISELHLEQFERLLSYLQINPELATAVADWIDSDTYPEFPGGAEDAEYVALPQPYRTANQYITHPSELLSIKGFTRNTYRQLLPYITCLPTGTEINLNTAKSPVIVSLSSKMSESQALDLIKIRSNTPFEQGNNDILDNLANFDANDLEIATSVSSQYYVSELEVGIGDRLYRQHSYLYRDQSGQTGVYQRIRMPKRLPENKENTQNTIDDSNTLLINGQSRLQ